jgi:hypothetical protein
LFVAISKGPDAVADFVLAERTNGRVVDICKGLFDELETKPGARVSDRDAKYWILATLAEPEPQPRSLRQAWEKSFFACLFVIACKVLFQRCGFDRSTS